MILADSFCTTLKTCGPFSVETDIESSGRAEEPLRCCNGHVRLSIAFAVSLSLHLAAAALLAAFVHSNGISSGRLAGLSDAPLIVSIAKPEKRSQSAVSPSKQFVSVQAPHNLNAHFATQNSAQGGIASSQYIGLPGLYFSTSELDVIPKIRRDIDLYPSELHNSKHSGGKVILRLWIDEAGHVAKVEMASSDLPAVFAEVAARAFMQADFLPGRKNGLAVKSKVEAALFYPPRDSSR